MRDPEYQNLEKLITQRDVKGLIKALRDSKTRPLAQKALIEIGPPAIRKLIAVLKDKEVSLSVAEVLIEMGMPVVQSLIEALENKRVSAYAAIILEDIGQPVVETLCAALPSLNLRGRYLAIRALGQIGDVRAILPISSILQEAPPDFSQRHFLTVSFDALGKLTHGGDIADLDKIPLEEFKKRLNQIGFKVSRRSDRYYYNSEHPDLRFVIQKRIVRLDKRISNRKGKKKWELWHSFLVAEGLHHALIAADALRRKAGLVA